MADVATQTLALAIGAGCLVSLVSDRLKVSATLPLIGVGFALGPHALGVIDADSLGEGLSAVISVVIGLLIFEGGLHLNRRELSHSPRALAGLLIVGAVVTYAGAGAAAHFVAGLSWPVALVTGAVLVVTGPTVIQPMLRRLPLNPRLHASLAGEAVLIDPLGVIVAVTTAEVAAAWIGGTGASVESVVRMGRPFVIGTVVGVGLGVAARTVIELISKRQRIPADLVHMLAVGTCMVAVGAGEGFAAEAGLVAATLCSVIMANTKMLGISEMREFKQRLASIFVAMLFVLLASRVNLGELVTAPASRWVFVAVLIAVVRPVSALAATVGSGLAWRERAFIAAFAPRGIVAASMGSLLAAQLAGPVSGWLEDEVAREALVREARVLEQLVYVAVIGTITWAALVGPVLARVLGVRVPAREGVVIVGAGALGRAVGEALLRRNVPVHLVDTNAARVAAAASAGLDASAADATDQRWMDDHVNRPELGWLMPLTGNRDVDQSAARWAEERFGPGRVLWARALGEGGDGESGASLDAGLINAVESGAMTLAESPAAEGGEVVLAVLDERGRPTRAGAIKPGWTALTVRANDLASRAAVVRARGAGGAGGSSGGAGGAGA